MEDIFKHSGPNIGGINPVEFVFTEDVESITIDYNTLAGLITLLSGKEWQYLYGTDGTIQIECKEDDTDAGTKYTYQVKLLIPKDRADVEASLMRLKSKGLITKVHDKNGIIRLFGEIENPMKLSSKLLKPADVPGYNGWEVIISGQFSAPASYISVSRSDLPRERPIEEEDTETG